MEKKLLLLGLLRQHEMHGYQLFELIDRSLSTCTDLTKPTAYYLLNSMAQAGWIAEEEDRQGNRPPRRVYRLTPQGEAEYQRLLRQNLAAFLPATFPGDTGLALLDSLDLQEALALLGERRAALVEALQTARAVPQHLGSQQLVIEHQVQHLSAELEWLDQVAARLRHSSGDSHQPAGQS